MRCCSDKSYNRALRCILQSILCVDDHPLWSAKVVISAHGITHAFQGDFTMLLPVDRKVSATVSFVDRGGNLAAVEGYVWGTDRPDLLTVDAVDGVATITPVGPLGSAQVVVTADADLGEGITELVLLAQIEVIAGTAVGGSINFSEPVPV